MVNLPTCMCASRGSIEPGRCCAEQPEAPLEQLTLPARTLQGSEGRGARYSQNVSESRRNNTRYCQVVGKNNAARLFRWHIAAAVSSAKCQAMAASSDAHQSLRVRRLPSGLKRGLAGWHDWSPGLEEEGAGQLQLWAVHGGEDLARVTHSLPQAEYCLLLLARAGDLRWALAIGWIGHGVPSAEQVHVQPAVRLPAIQA